MEEKIVYFTHEMLYTNKDDQKQVDFGYLVEGRGFYSLISDNFYSSFEIESSKSFKENHKDVSFQESQGHIVRESHKDGFIKKLRRK